MIGIFLRWLRIDQWPDRHFLFWHHFLQENLQTSHLQDICRMVWGWGWTSTPVKVEIYGPLNIYIYTVYIHIYIYLQIVRDSFKDPNQKDVTVSALHCLFPPVANEGTTQRSKWHKPTPTSPRAFEPRSPAAVREHDDHISNGQSIDIPKTIKIHLRCVLTQKICLVLDKVIKTPKFTSVH